jgi:hypothetical protein
MTHCNSCIRCAPKTAKIESRPQARHWRSYKTVAEGDRPSAIVENHSQFEVIPQASANFRSPLKSPAFAVALALTSIPINAPLPVSITRSTSLESPHEPRWIPACRSQHRVVVHGDEFAIARDQIADQGGLASLARPRNHDDRRVLERGGH